MYVDNGDSDASSEAEEVISNWLDELDDDEEVKLVGAAASAAVVAHNSSRTPAPTHPVLCENLDLYYSLCDVEDLDFSLKSEETQVLLFSTIEVVEFVAGQNVFEAGDSSEDFYIIVSSDAAVGLTRVAVIGRTAQGSETLITYLHRGQYFGQMFFLTRQKRVRSATIRIPSFSESGSVSAPVRLARVSVEHFETWAALRTMLIVKVSQNYLSATLYHRPRDQSRP